MGELASGDGGRLHLSGKAASRCLTHFKPTKSKSNDYINDYNIIYLH
jgi:hypothetical protein